MLLPLDVFLCAGSLFCGVAFVALSSLVVRLLRRKDLVALNTLNVLWLSVFWCFSVFCLSSSRCIGLVCGLRVWHFPFIGTCFLDGTNYITECNLGKVSFIVLLNPYSDIYNLQQITISNFAAFSKKKKKKKKK